MPSRSHESRLPPDSNHDSATVRAAEPRNPDMPPAEITTAPAGPHAGFDADLNPIDDEFINTHGSER